MFLLGRVASPAQRERFLKPLIDGHTRSAFFMTEPAADGEEEGEHAPEEQLGRPPLGAARDLID